MYFTVASTSTAGPSFRVRASKLRTGGTLIVAVPVNNVTSTLDQLIILELLVTGGALVGAILLGLWLVRVGLRPLRDVVRTAEAITAGDLMHRVPNASEPHRGRPCRYCSQRDAGTDPSCLQRSSGLRESPAPFRLRRLARAANPIVAVSAYAQLFKHAAQHEEDLPRVMDGIERETARMGRLVEDLLLLRGGRATSLRPRGGGARRSCRRGSRDGPDGGAVVAHQVRGWWPCRGHGRPGVAPPGRRQPPRERTRTHSAGNGSRRDRWT